MTDGKRSILTLLLAALLVLSSCGTAAEETGTGTAAETETELPGPTLPDTTWEDADFNIYVWELSKSVFVAEEQSGDILNDAKFEMIAQLEETFLVNVTALTAAGDSQGTKVSSSILAGDDTYSLLAGHARAMFAYPDSHLAYDWYMLPYIDFENPWWDQNMLQDMTIAGKIYVVPDDLTESSLHDTKCMVLNKDLFREFGLDLPYEAALNGEWTFDMFEEICLQFSRDLNGDGALDADNDQFGFMSTGWGAPINVLWTADQRIVDFTGEGGRLEYVVNNEVAVDVYETFFAFMSRDGARIEPDIQKMYAAFRDGRVAIRGGGLGDIAVEREMEYDIGLLPYPKFTADQERYATGVDAGCNGLVIPVTISDPEMVSAVVETWAYLYYRDVLPVYYDTVCKTKAARDEETAQILDIIRDSRLYDIGYFYGNLPMNSIGYDLSQSNVNFASYYAQNEKKGQAALDKINEYYFG